MAIAARSRRKPDHAIDPAFVERWSPRAMSGQELGAEDLAAVFEAARWAPSSYNNQPWRFVHARRGGPHWHGFLDLLADGNRIWASRAGALVVIASRRTFERNGRPSRTHEFDTGAAWGYLALQGSMRGLVVHGMEGFDYDKARALIGAPADFDVLAMAAVGRPGRVEDLPEPLRRVESPSGRKKVAEIAFEGRFPG